MSFGFVAASIHCKSTFGPNLIHAASFFLFFFFFFSFFVCRMVADLVAGIYYQKCHDPECRRVGYRSPWQPLPPRLLGKDEKDVRPSLC